MNTDPSSQISMIYAMLKEHHGASPIMIDQSLLSDHDTKIRVQPCKWDGCAMYVGLEHKHVSKHLQHRHGLNTSATSEETQGISCLWSNCFHSQMKPGNMARHVLSTHLGVRWNCLTCQKSYTRDDAFRRHTQEKPSCQYARPAVSFGDGSREIDTAGINSGCSFEQNVICIP
ncbi:hypothetical protein M405DRAFT_814950 [Rhizopogon salebrosus TDB-379]|nr:hypothetical protein M405DRAFT_814950 [Rhizopogon salebrosus TDB-379]